MCWNFKINGRIDANGDTDNEQQRKCENLNNEYKHLHHWVEISYDEK